MSDRFFYSAKWAITAISTIFFCSIAHSEERKCYPSLSQFMATKFGGDYRQDEKLSNKIAVDSLLMVVDATPGNNPSRYFFLLERGGNQVCLVLNAPIALDVDFGRRPMGKSPRKITTTSQGGSEIVYEWREEPQKYVPIKCAKTRSGKKLPVSCASVLGVFGR